MDLEYLLQIHMMLCLTSLLDNTYNTTASSIIELLNEKQDGNTEFYLKLHCHAV